MDCKIREPNDSIPQYFKFPQVEKETRLWEEKSVQLLQKVGTVFQFNPLWDKEAHTVISISFWLTPDDFIQYIVGRLPLNVIR